jgi:GcvH upstream region-like protein
MLGFFRKYQRYFFVVVTIVIIISFSFFGTYSAMSNPSAREQIAFVAIDGTPITRYELDQMAMFLGTDAEDKLLFGGMWGPNFLNDGLIKKDFLQTGLAELLAAQYLEEIENDIAARYEKEKRFEPYVHPQAQFLGTETAWNYLAPDIKTHYDALKNVRNPNSPEGIKERIQLFLAEKKLPSPFLRQVLLYQQKQYSWLPPDPALERIDLSLFGYHTIEDWFGPRFTRLVAEFVINAAILAEQQGYRVSKADALADLMYNSESSYKQNVSNPNLGVANNSEYFIEQLHRMQLGESNAAAIWEKVLLFRRWFRDVGGSVFVDPLMFQKYDAYAMETVEGELYRLPPEFRFGNYRDLQAFEIYLSAISKRPSEGKALLSLPGKVYTAAEVAKSNPELVQKRYLLDVSTYDKNQLQDKVGIKEMWNWEVENPNWKRLQKEFPDLGVKNAESKEERFAVLDGLDDKIRAKVDLFTRKAIVESHPEWLEQALQDAESRRITFAIRLKGGASSLAGIKNGPEFMKLLDQTKLGEQDPSLAKYSADGDHFYRIVVVDRSQDLEILTFAEAQNDGILTPLVSKKLEVYYQQVREADGEKFQREDKSWKSFSDVREEIANLYFAKTLKAIHEYYASAMAPNQVPNQLIADVSASLRFFPYFRGFLDKVKKDPAGVDAYIQPTQEVAENDKLGIRTNLTDQWKLENMAYQAERGGEAGDVDLVEAFAMKPNSWSQIHTPVNGDINILFLTTLGNDANFDSLVTRVAAARDLLSNEAQQILMEQVLHRIKEKNAISLDYLDQGQGAEMEEKSSE